jgi:hypothetical protein
VAAGPRLRSGQGGPGGRGTTGAPSPERRALSRHRRLGHRRRRHASTADRREMAAAGVLLQEVVGGGHQVLHLRQGAAGRFQRVQTFQILTGGATVLPTDRPQATRHIPVPHNAAVVGPPAVATLLHRRIHIRHQTHTGQENVVADALSRPPSATAQPPLPSQRPSTALTAEDWPEEGLAAPDRPILAAIADGQPVDFSAMAAMMNSSTLQITTQTVGVTTLLGDVSTGVFRPLVPVQHREAVFQSLHSIHHPGVRATRGLIAARFCWPQMAKAITQMARACLQCQRGKVHRHVHLQPTRYRYLTAVSPTSMWTWSGRSRLRAATLTCSPSLTGHRDGRKPSRSLHHRSQLRQGPLRWLGITLRSTSHHHFRQRGPIHVRSLGGPVQPAQHPALTHDSIPPPVKNGLVERFHRRLKDALQSRVAAADWHDHLPWVLLGNRTAFREDSEFSPAEVVYGSQLVLPGQFINTAESPSPSFLRELQTMMTGRPPPPARHNAALTPSALPEELLLARFVLVRRDGAQPPLSPIYDGPYRVLEWSTHFFLLKMGDRTDKVSTLRLKAARTPADMEPAKPPCRGRPVAQAPPVRAPPPKQRGRPRQVTFSLPPTTPPTTTSTSSASGCPLRTAGRRTDSTSEPAAAEFGGDLWWRTICSYCVSCLDCHVTYYTSHMCTYADTRLSMPSLKYTVVAWLLTCLQVSTQPSKS